MGIFYTQHLLERMEQRGISKQTLQDAWKYGEHKEDPRGKITVQYETNQKKLKIIAKRKGKHFILVTSYYYD